MAKTDNIVPRGATMDLGDKKNLRLVFITRAIQHVKEKHGGFQKAIRALDDENGDIDFSILADLIYAGLMINKDAEITLAYVTSALEEMPIYDVKELAQTHLVAAITGSYPESKKAGDSSTPQ